MGRDVTAAIVEAAQLSPGMRVLDLACGTGEPTISLATLLQGTGEAIGIDISTEPLKLAAERAAARGLTNVNFQHADVHQLPFPDHAFDRITSRLGVMFFADLPRAANEIYRVLKPGGRIAFLAWGPMQQPYFDSTAGTVLRMMPGAQVPEGGEQAFRFGRTGFLTEILRGAGFKEVDEKLVTLPWTWPGTPAEVWSYFQSTAVPFAPLFKSIPPGRHHEVEAAVLSAISRYCVGNEIRFTATMNLTSATK